MKNLLSAALLLLSFSLIAQNSCSVIIETDDFTGEINKYSQTKNLLFWQVIKDYDTTNYIDFTTTSSHLSVDGKGLIVLFKDGSKLEWPYKIKVNAANGKYNYSCFFSPTESDLIELSSKDIDKYRMYIYDKDISPQEAEEFRTKLKCLIGK